MVIQEIFKTPLEKLIKDEIDDLVRGGVKSFDDVAGAMQIILGNKTSLGGTFWVNTGNVMAIGSIKTGNALIKIARRHDFL